MAPLYLLLGSTMALAEFLSASARAWIIWSGIGKRL
jgi:hypothetical protein